MKNPADERRGFDDETGKRIGDSATTADATDETETGERRQPGPGGRRKRHGRDLMAEE